MYLQNFASSGNVIRNSKNIFLFIWNLTGFYKKEQICFLFIRKGYKVFSPLRYENDLFIIKYDKNN